MYAVVEHFSDAGIAGVTLRKTKYNAIRFAVKIFKEQYAGSDYTPEEIERKAQDAEDDLEKYGSAYIGNWGISINTVNKR